MQLRTIQRKSEVSMLINGWVTANIVFHGSNFVHHHGICNWICVKHLQAMSGVITCRFKKNDVSISNCFPGVHKRGIHIHDDSIRRNTTHRISPKIKAYCDDLAINGFERGFNSVQPPCYPVCPLPLPLHSILIVSINSQAIYVTCLEFYTSL